MHSVPHRIVCVTFTDASQPCDRAAMDWYIVIKTIKGRRYRYRQKTWRENGRVRTRSEYIGPAADLGGTPTHPEAETTPVKEAAADKAAE